MTRERGRMARSGVARKGHSGISSGALLDGPLVSARKRKAPPFRETSRSNAVAAVANRPASVDVLRFAQSIWQAFGTPLSEQLSEMARKGRFAELVREDVAASSYTDPFEFYLDYQAVKLLSKNPHLDTGIDTAKVALRKFVEFEALCQETNARFRPDAMTGIPSHLARVLYAAQAKIVSILGDVPDLEALDFRFGPGAAFGVRGDTSSYHKVTSALECTHNMIAALPDFLGEFPGWVTEATAEVTLVQGSDLALVPKDAKTDRVICIEPLLNGLMQKGIGTWIRDCLKRHGVDLDDQSVNQRLAGHALRDNLATVDFSSASDSIAYNLVWSLLPPDWATFLDACRCPRYRCEGSWYSFQKFSSMGNAYTFELETLIFYALAYACCIETGIRPETAVNLSVYGDDVIIPQDSFGLFREASEWCGFKVNASKTFATGSFFESCGCDYFTGMLVTPFRLKRPLRTHDELTYGANFILRICERLYALATTETQRAKAYDICSKLGDCHRDVVLGIPRRYMVLGPWSVQDQWLIAPFDRVCPAKGSFGWRHKALIQRPRKHREEHWPMAYALYNAQDYSAGPTLSPGSITTLAKSCARDKGTVIQHSAGASLREGVKTSIGNFQSPDWEFPWKLAMHYWQEY